MSELNFQYRVDLSDPDRGLQVSQKLIAVQHPSETSEHLTLRVLAFCVFYTPSLRFGPGLSAPETPDLWAHDAAEKLTTWVECGAADPARLRQVIQHHREASVHVLFSEEQAWRAFDAEAHKLKHRPARFAEIDVRKVESEVVSRLAVSALRRRRWIVTLVGDHLYIDADGVAFDTPVERRRLVLDG